MVREEGEDLQIKIQWCAGQPASPPECDSERDKRKQVKDEGQSRREVLSPRD